MVSMSSKASLMQLHLSVSFAGSLRSRLDHGAECGRRRLLHRLLPESKTPLDLMSEYHVDEPQSEDCLYLNVWSPRPALLIGR